MRKINQQALRRSMWGSLSRVIGVALGVSAGAMLHEFFGEYISGLTMGGLMAIASFILMWFSEYEKESIRIPSEPVDKLQISQNTGEPPLKTQKLYHCNNSTSIKCMCKNS